MKIKKCKDCIWISNTGIECEYDPQTHPISHRSMACRHYKNERKDNDGK